MADNSTTTGSSTIPAATPATKENAPPTTAAPSSEPAPNTQRNMKSRTQRNYQARKPFDGTTAKSSGLSQMLSTVADLPFSAIPRHTPTYVVPCFTEFFHVLHLCDQQMVHTRRFTDANHDWMPFVSQLYFSVLLYYTVLKNQQIGAALSQEQSDFLRFIEDNFPNIDSAKIPGPLKPWFESLASNAGPNEDYGNLVFGIPNNTSVTQARHFMMSNRLNAHIPNIIVILDQFMRWIRVLVPVNAAPAQITLEHTDNFYTHIFGTAATATAASRVCMQSPNARFDIPMTQAIVTNFLGSINTWLDSLPFDANGASCYTTGTSTTELSFAQVLGFRGVGTASNSMFDWFTQASRIMQPYADFFRDSTSLGSITTVGIGAAYIRAEISNTAANATIYTNGPQTRRVRYTTSNVLRYYQPSFTISNELRFAHPIEYLDTVTEQLGMLTQMNVSWTRINARAGVVFPGPLAANSATGPIMEMIQLRQRNSVNVASTIPNIISGYYHVPAALKFE
uniref:Coat protein n=1 Tax=Ceratobasidium partitivirus CP-b1 TaxID=1970087 RepID=A0A219WGJ5_9VIRU|nr:coat protein [Ceratobasidium partitivirus CP-b1]